MKGWQYVCDLCSAAATMFQGKQGSLWYNCPACGARINLPVGTDSHRKVSKELGA